MHFSPFSVTSAFTFRIAIAGAPVCHLAAAGGNELTAPFALSENAPASPTRMLECTQVVRVKVA